MSHTGSLGPVVQATVEPTQAQFGSELGLRFTAGTDTIDVLIVPADLTANGWQLVLKRIPATGPPELLARSQAINLNSAGKLHLTVVRRPGGEIAVLAEGDIGDDAASIQAGTSLHDIGGSLSFVVHTDHKQDTAGTFTNLTYDTPSDWALRTATYKTDDSDELETVVTTTSDGATPIVETYEHDNFRRITSRHTTVGGVTTALQTYGYDARDRIAKIVHGDGTSEIHKYHAGTVLRRETQRFDNLGAWVGTETYEYAAGELQAHISANNLVTRYLKGANGTIGQWHDLGGSNQALVGLARDLHGHSVGTIGADPNGGTDIDRLSKVRFDAWGETLAQWSINGSGNLALNSGVNTMTGPGYRGLWQDGKNGTVLMGARLYDPSLGRFLWRDPAMANDNHFAYAGDFGDPVNRKDPTGLDWEWADGRWRHMEGSNPFVPKPTFSGYEGEIVNAQRYQQIRRFGSINLETMLNNYAIAKRGERIFRGEMGSPKLGPDTGLPWPSGVINDHSFGSQFESPYAHFGTADGPSLREVRSHYKNDFLFNHSFGSQAEMNAVMLRGERLADHTGLIPMSVSGADAFTVMSSRAEHQRKRSMTRQLYGHILHSQWYAREKVKLEAELISELVVSPLAAAGGVQAFARAAATTRSSKRLLGKGMLIASEELVPLNQSRLLAEVIPDNKHAMLVAHGGATIGHKVVPPGQSVTLYGREGYQMPAGLAEYVTAGEFEALGRSTLAMDGVLDGSRTFLPGSTIPIHPLFPARDIRFPSGHGVISVSYDSDLSEYLVPRSGHLEVVICRGDRHYGCLIMDFDKLNSEFSAIIDTTPKVVNP